MIIFYDLETTGLPNKSNPCLPGIIQLAAILYDADGNEVAEYNTRVDPELDADLWEPGAIRTTGIGPEDVGRDWPSMFMVAPEFSEFCRQANCLAGYNHVAFDDVVLYNNLVRYGYEKNFSWPMRRLDVMNVAKKRYKSLPGHMAHAGRAGAPPKLVVLHEMLFGEKFDGAHDALADVRATARCAFEIAHNEIQELSC